MDSQLKDKLHRICKKHHDKVVENRRHLHQHPELSFEERETGRYIQDQLSEMGIPFTTGWAGFGVVGEIVGQQVGPLIALRADIDALPILEKNEVSYKSIHEGKMHACGHDVHTASLLGVARVLNEVKEDIKGSIRLIFQPGEEKLPGGASIMIKEGVLEEPKPVLILGQHVHPPLEAGKVGIKGGPYMASADEIYLTVHGKGGHAALPHECVDPVTISAQVLIALQQVISRKAPPTSPSVLSFGKINSEGGATNVIPNQVKIEGTFRAMNEEWRAKAHEEIERIAKETASALGGSCDVDIKKGYPYLQNNESLTQKVKSLMQECLGTENVVDLPIRMTAEDFSYYSQETDACFYRLGTGNIEKGIKSPVHTNTFNIDEDALLTGVQTMSYLAIGLLNRIK